MRELIERLEKGGRDCILWPRKLDHAGRGRIWHLGKLKLAHRWAWERVNGRSVPDGMFVCHHCDNPTCVNPDHLYVGTHQDNMRDMVQRERSMAKRYPDLARDLGYRTGSQNNWARGADNPKAKLSPDDVEAIRNDSRLTSVLAAEFGVTRTTIQRIRSGRAWREVHDVEAA